VHGLLLRSSRPRRAEDRARHAEAPDAARVSRGARLAFTDCLGPCSEANVVFLYVHGRPLWLRRINTADTFGALLDYAREAVEGGPVALPPALGRHAFTWTGGGSGPPPPVAE